jgi:hypothetical protein
MDGTMTTHVQIDLALFWKILIGVLSGMVLIVGWWVKRWINRWDKWKEDVDKKGGVVTRDDHFYWCKPMQETCKHEIYCRIEAIEDWRSDIMEKGGPLPKFEHADLCEKVTGKIFQQIEASLNQQHKLVDSKLQLIQVTLQKDVIEEIRNLKKELNHRNGSK